MTMMDGAGDPVHSRTIDMRTFRYDENHIIVEGVLHEKRLQDYFLITGEERSAGDLHHMVVRFLLEIPGLVIKKVETEMKAYPREECIKMEASLGQLEGLAVAPGFSSEVRKRLGGVKGCLHLNHLVTTMAPAIMQGFWAEMATRPPVQGNELNRMKASHGTLKNTCYAWREDGPAFQSLEERMRQYEKEEG